MSDEPSLTDAIIASVLHQGGERLKAKVRQATGQLDPHRILVSGVVDGVKDGLLEILVFMPGTKPRAVQIPFGNLFATEAESLVGHAVKLTVEIAR